MDLKHFPCGHDRIESNFYTYKNKTWCKECTRERHRQYSKNNRLKRNMMQKDWLDRNPHKRKEYHMKFNFKLSDQQYKDMVDKFKGTCYICGELPQRKSLHIDHDHNCCPTVPTCGKCTRGLLCARCNVLVGFLESDPVLIQKAQVYLGR